MELRRKSINLSYYLKQLRQQHAFSNTSNFWFGAILSLFEQNVNNDINDDLSMNQKIQMMKIISKTLSTISNFYQQQRPNSIYKLLNFVEYFLDQLNQSKQYGIVISKVNYLNILSIYAIKTRQYTYALDNFNEIYQIYNSKIIDNTNQFFLSFFNNYLIFLKKTNKKMTSKMLEIQNLLKDNFIKYFTKLILFDNFPNKQTFIGAINLLVAIYKQNQPLFLKYQKDINSLIHYQYLGLIKAKRKIPQDLINYIFNQKIKKYIYFYISYQQDQIKFYSAHRPKFTQSVVLKRHQEDEQPQKRLTKIQAMLQQSIQMLSEQKVTSARYANLQKMQVNRNNQSFSLNTIQNTISSIKPQPQPSKNLQTLQPLPRTFTKKRQISNIRSNSKPLTKLVRFKTIIFKIRSIFIEINEDGILLSDYTKQNKRHVQWNTLSMIIERINLHFPFEQFLKIPLQNYYDFVRIISFYLTKNDDKQICLIPKPLPLLEVNQLIKLYKQQGKYLKLALMNPYDNSKFVGIIDCYMSQFSQFFKYLNQNEYLCILNEKIFKGVGAYDKDENTYVLDYIKRKRQTTVAQFGTQLQAQYLDYAIEQKNTIYKCLFLLKNSLQIYVKIIDNIKMNTLFDGYIIEIKIDNINTLGNQTFYLSSQKQIKDINSKKINKLIQIPIYKLLYYFPQYNFNLKDYLSYYSRMIVDMLNYFDDYTDQINLGGLSFDIKIHAFKSQMIQYGKYYSSVSAELVGSKERVWAMIIRFYDLAFTTSKITVLMNPYHQFLQCAINANNEDKNQIMKNLLINESVKQTYNWLKKGDKVGKKINIFQYLYANQLI